MPFPFTSSSTHASSSNGRSGSKWSLLRNAVKSSSPTTTHFLRQFSKAITEQISTEIYELVIDHLYGDKRTLLTCMLVCRSWVPRSKALLLESTVCHPVPLIGHGGFGKITCAVPDHSGNIIYGTTEGVYRGTPNGSRPRLLSTQDVTQIEILPDTDLFIYLAGGVFMTMPLSILNSGACQNSDINRLSKHVASFTVYRSTVAGKGHRMCALKTSTLSSTIKVFDIDVQLFTLRVALELYIPSESYSVRFLTRTRLAAAIKKGGGGFEMVDLLTAETQSLLDPDDPALDLALNKKIKPLTVFRASDIFIVCYDKFGFYIDRRGRMARNELLMRWTAPATAPALHEPYLLAFSETHVEAWNIETAEMLQKIRGQCTLLNAPESGEDILSLSLASGDISKMLFHER
ncbi:CNH domain-containing protein [Mycena crocata]|nr:CNH domain-containing protein [Mycena crocata]